MEEKRMRIILNTNGRSSSVHVSSHNWYSSLIFQFNRLTKQQTNNWRRISPSPWQEFWTTHLICWSKQQQQWLHWWTRWWEPASRRGRRPNLGQIGRCRCPKVARAGQKPLDTESQGSRELGFPTRPTRIRVLPPGKGGSVNNFLRASNLPRQSSSALIDPNQQKFLKSILINNTTMPKGAK